MTGNPFNRVLDQSLRGKKVIVKSTDGTLFRGWVDRIHHQKGSVVLHDAVVLASEELEPDPPAVQTDGPVWVRTVEWLTAADESGKQIQMATLSNVEPSPYLDADFEIADDHVRGAYRDGFTGSFPVVRSVDDHWELINGHKRIAACRAAGLRNHPVEVVSVDDETARELVELAHDEEDVVPEVES